MLHSLRDVRFDQAPTDLTPKRLAVPRSFLRLSMPLYSFPNPRQLLQRLPPFLVRRRRHLLRRASSSILINVVNLLTDNRSTLCSSPSASDYDENDSYDPNYYVASENDGLYNIYTAESVVPQMQAVRVAHMLNSL